MLAVGIRRSSRVAQDREACEANEAASCARVGERRGAMRIRRFLAGAALLLLVNLALSDAIGATVAHATAPPAAQALSASSAEITKTTLNETSVDGPALWTTTNGAVRGVLAWADPMLRLNVMTTAIGTKFANKVRLGDTSPRRPAVTRTADGKAAIAWIGADSARTLNVLYDVYGNRQKLTLWGETSSFSPALVEATGNLYLAWTGTNAAHSLNVLTISTSGGRLSKGTKTILRSFSSLAGPSLRYESSRSEYLLSWIATAPANRIAFSKATNPGAAGGWSAATVLSDWSYSTPSLLGIVGGYYNMPPHYLAWTGGNTARSLNFQYTRSFPSWPDPTNTKVVLNESAYGPPALGFISGPGIVLLAWAGTDSAHHLNVAVLTPMSPSPCALPGISPVTPRVITRGTSGRKEVALTFDAGGAEGQPFSLLSTLEAAGAPSTWFFTAEWAQGHQAVIDRVVADHIVIGNHTVDHPDLVNPARSSNFVCYQLGLANQIIVDRDHGAATRPWFRPPYGSYNTGGVNATAGIGYYTVMWSIDTLDWDDATTASDILNTVKSQLGPGKIILMHVGSLHEPEALPNVIAYIKSQGYNIVTLEQLLAP
jgi:peptidoglycan/xylan/chitin deacetylase (PgdA/CDA1 family)